jgi:hypothetical protein
MHSLSWLVLWACAASSHSFFVPTVYRHLATPLRAGAYGSEMSVAELKEELRAKGLKVSGLKAELQARLLEASSLREAPPTSTAAPAPFVPGAPVGVPPRPKVVHLSKKQEQLYTKDEPLSKRVFVANLDLSLANLEAQVAAVLGAHGVVAAVDMGINKLTGAAAPFCWVDFETDAGAAAAVANLHGSSTSSLSSMAKDAGALRVELSHQTGSAARARERNRCALSDDRIEELVAERESQRKQGLPSVGERDRDARWGHVGVGSEH